MIADNSNELPLITRTPPARHSVDHPSRLLIRLYHQHARAGMRQQIL